MRYSILGALLFFVGWAFAGNVTEQQARRVAVAFFQSAPQTRVSESDLRLVRDSESTLTRSGGAAPAYYVFDNAAGGGFVIVSGDDVASPVLGYSFTEEFPEGNLPSNVQGWLDGLREEINAARRDGVEAEEAVTRAWQETRSGDVVVDMQTARWDQGDPYNLLCPMVSGQRTYTGCTATALAIIMRYHQWPERGVGTLPAYNTETFGISIPALELGHTYDWANMPLDYSSSSTTTQEEAVATLMRDCSVLLQSDYGTNATGGTGAYVDEVLKTVEYMGYDKAMRCEMRDSYTSGEWYELMQTELDNRRPVLYTGSNDEGGHAFVLDGYTTDNYYSVNWGWSGYYNGYFLLSALDPEGQGTGGSGSYNIGQVAVIGMQKDQGGEYVENIRFSPSNEIDGVVYNGFTIQGTVSQNTPFTFAAGLFTNMGAQSFTGEILFAVADKEGRIVEELETITLDDLDVYYGVYIREATLTVTVPIEKGYRLRAYFRSEKTPEWTLIRGNDEEGCVWEYILLDEYTIEQSTSFTYNKNDRKIYLTVSNGISVSLTDASGKDYDRVCRREGTSVTINAILLPAGTYTLTLQRGNEQKDLRFTIGAAQ